MSKILYLHGLASSGTSRTPENLRKVFPHETIIAPDLPVEPQAALQLLRTLCREERPAVVIGASMGAMYAQQLFGYKKVLANPAFHISRILRENLGTMKFLNPRRDGAESFEVTPALVAAYEEMEAHQFEGITPFDLENTYAFFGRNDRLVNCREEYAALGYEQAATFEGEHRLTYQNVRDTLCPLVVRLL